MEGAPRGRGQLQDDVGCGAGDGARPGQAMALSEVDSKKPSAPLPGCLEG